MLRVLGTVSSISLVKFTIPDVVDVSTTGLWPLTVTLSVTAPIFKATSRRATKPAVSRTLSRITR